ncbi:hypothetical protein B5G34_16695 [Flavonifractor sp. An82]|uniref:YveK family protein n=1 Tax=Flavonifractor sp. An82 TaxID=1965660 RepID=UPI000B39C19C|nr:Wzz/FepE/Etk N-terminal domain-containing protein [Flavonifractor sp. An82]OUN19918.1 hypothetical protein B5G34_16695 [Flavonifractor sp. An82]
MVERKKENMEIDLMRLLFLYLRKWWLILLCAIIGGGIMYFYTANFVTPMYQAGVTIYVNNIESGQQIDYISGSNLTASQQLVSTYVNIIRSDTVLEKVADSMEMDISAEYIRSIMSASQVGETELFDVYISHPDPEMAALIANAVAEVAPGEIESFVEGSSTKIVDYAKVPESPYSPSYRKNIMLGAAVGVVLIVAILTVRDLLDVRIKREEDLLEISDLPVLGRIPVFTSGKGQKR